MLKSKINARHALALAVAACAFYVFLAIRVRKTKEAKKTAQTKALLCTLAQATISYHKCYGLWPVDLGNLTTNSSNVIFAVNPPIDGWGTPVLFSNCREDRGFGELRSLGSDKKPGGTSFGADIIIRFQTESWATVEKVSP
jgi:hypothetical protein